MSCHDEVINCVPARGISEQSLWKVSSLNGEANGDGIFGFSEQMLIAENNPRHLFLVGRNSSNKEGSIMMDQFSFLQHS